MELSHIKSYIIHNLAMQHTPCSQLIYFGRGKYYGNDVGIYLFQARLSGDGLKERVVLEKRIESLPKR
jgi:hypothetical protein